MNATLARKLRFSDVVYAINTTPKSLRLWLQRGLVEIHTPQQEGGWTEYSFIDIAILSLIRTFVTFGVDVPTASGMANRAMEFFPMVMGGFGDKMPAGVLAASWVNRRLHCFPKDGEWQMCLVTLWESDLDPDRHEGFDPNLPSGVAALRAEMELSPAFISVDVATVIRTALERAGESVNEGRDDE